MHVLFIQYPSCSTCRKAKNWLAEHKIAFEDRHIVESTPTLEELTNFYQKSGLALKKFFNTNGLVYKELGLKDKLASMSEKEQLELLSSNGMLIKRPLLITDNTVLVGFKEADWSKALI